ncbi:MAG: GTPase Era [Erysipelothrix sp.]|nr:GTPase Era [Erysipelothrix sp.]
MTKAGTVALIGRPNAGKSTLLNALMQTKVAITSAKAQTTRNVILGVYNDDQGQIVFLDTPGFHQPKDALSSMMVKSTVATLKEVDLILFMIDITKKEKAVDKTLYDLVKQTSSPVFAIVNKIDMMNRNAIIPLLEHYATNYEFNEIIPLSALNQDNLERLVEVILKELPEQERLYPQEQLTQLTYQFYISEVIREKLLNLTNQEIPHSSAVVIDTLSFTDSTCTIEASIIVEKDSQKGIVIGAKGALKNEIIKQVSMELRRQYGLKILLSLHVKVDKDWRLKTSKINAYLNPNQSEYEQ